MALIIPTIVEKTVAALPPGTLSLEQQATINQQLQQIYAEFAQKQSSPDAFEILAPIAGTFVGGPVVGAFVGAALAQSAQQDVQSAKDAITALQPPITAWRAQQAAEARAEWETGLAGLAAGSATQLQTFGRELAELRATSGAASQVFLGTRDSLPRMPGSTWATSRSWQGFFQQFLTTTRRGRRPVRQTWSWGVITG